ncbi:hypothetical protein LSTR_LSTR002114 [Laodelphax striatellus]|uniref:TMEM9 family protein n=1 Tax=Laodelphax striatellus TaxID=195883 RepID=A0A482XRG5_LAOST|nr:hypothetical protein LSTR_LSTR002114 [Laodelphax striatellus]
MLLKIAVISIFVLAFQVNDSSAQLYEDARCKCVCTIINGTQNYKKLYVANVPSNNDCLGIEVPPIAPLDNSTKVPPCPQCQCRYESRNTTVIKVVVIIVIWIISLLVIYMLFLICLDPLLNKRVKSSYIEHTNEERPEIIMLMAPLLSISPSPSDEESGSASSPGSSSHQMGVRGGNVLNRMGHQQDKWKRQVREQRKNIYDRHTMLN